MSRSIRIMKFGGTSLGDASCIRKAVKIVQAASADSQVVVVVSAMSGVTNTLIHAAKLAAAGEQEQVSAILRLLRLQHEAAANSLVSSVSEQDRLHCGIQRLLEEGSRAYRDLLTSGESTPQKLDLVGGLGERLVAPLMAAALGESGIPSESIEATSLIITNSTHGAAEPYMNLTRARCQLRLGALLQRGVIPVVTGFIGATEQGVPTTLGRNSSDYSATVIGAALKADDVTIWTDVNGVLTADPQVVRDACPIAKISYGEAVELARFGAKVLHPKTFRDVMQLGIPVWIRNTFEPETPGTRIASVPSAKSQGVTALASMTGLALISFRGRYRSPENFASRVSATAFSTSQDTWILKQSSPKESFSLVARSSGSMPLAEALRCEFAQETDQSFHDPVLPVGMITLVGPQGLKDDGIFERASRALDRHDIVVIGIAQSSSRNSLPLVLAEKNVKAALAIIHEEFKLSASKLQTVSVECS